jgi:hypothetical protein
MVARGSASATPGRSRNPASGWLAGCPFAGDTQVRAGREAEDLTTLYRLHNNAPGSRLGESLVVEVGIEVAEAPDVFLAEAPRRLLRGDHAEVGEATVQLFDVACCHFGRLLPYFGAVVSRGGGLLTFFLCP